MDLLDSIGTYLIGEGIGTALGTDVFSNHRPSSPDFVVVVTEYGGTPQMYVEAMQRRFQILIRHKSNSTAKLIAWKAHKALQEGNPIKQFTPDRWGVTTVLQTPTKVNIDDQGRPTFVFNISVAALGD
jgi:Bacteriophage minor capsid protein